MTVLTSLVSGFALSTVAASALLYRWVMESIEPQELEEIQAYGKGSSFCIVICWHLCLGISVVALAAHFHPKADPTLFLALNNVGLLLYALAVFFYFYEMYCRWSTLPSFLSRARVWFTSQLLPYLALSLWATYFIWAV